MSLALSTLIYEWRRYFAAIIALAVAGLLVLAMTGMFLGVGKAFTATIDRSPAEIMVLPAQADSLFGNNNGLPRRLIPTVYQHPDVTEVMPLDGSWAYWSNFPKDGQPAKGNGVQVMVNKGHAYICHAFSTGATVLDVRDPRNPKPVNFLPVHPASWSLHCQTNGDLLLMIEEFNFYSTFNSEKLYYEGSISGVHSSRFGKRGEDYSAGLRIYDIKDPANPRSIGFLEVEGLGLHRVWWDGGQYVYGSAFLDGYTDHVLMIIDIADPTKPREVGRWWLPGMWTAGGEKADFDGRVALHHALVAGDTAYGCWRDGGLTLVDVKDKANPKLIAHRNWRPPFAGGTHSAVRIAPERMAALTAATWVDVCQETG